MGMPQLFPGEIVKVEDMGKIFSGNYFLTQVTHIIDENGFRTRTAIERGS